MSARAQPGAAGIVLAAGLGSRVGADGNKAYLPVAGRSMAAWSLLAIASVPAITRSLLVFRRGERDLAHRTVCREVGSVVELVEGGDTRHASEYNVLRHLAGDIESGLLDVVLVHDAARPTAPPQLFSTALTVARTFGGALPAVPTADVVRSGPHGLEATGGPHRSLVRVQTPQAFRAVPLLMAYRAADQAGFEGTDTSSCVEKFADVDIRTYPGAESNIKVTYARDIAVAERLLSNPITGARPVDSRR